MITAEIFTQSIVKGKEMNEKKAHGVFGLCPSMCGKAPLFRAGE
jgi:hypothetical protein